MIPDNFRFAPRAASTYAPQMDALFLFELCVALFFVLLISTLILVFIVRYRRRSDDEIPEKMPHHYGLEALWTLVPFALMLVMFFWGAALYVKVKAPVQNAIEIHIIGKQWMWKIEHENGAREIDELHVPLGQPVKLILTSQDVVHDFYVPAFRMKQDVLPGSYVTEWFQATSLGEYHLFCSQYCGAGHSKMVGKVVVMRPQDYQAWLAGAVPADTPAAAGSKLFIAYGCIDCHGQRAPTMAGLYNSHVLLQDGSTVLADENYLHKSIVDPTNQLVAGYPPIMPSYINLTEDQINQLIAYIKSLQSVHNMPGGSSDAPTSAPSLIAPSTHPSPGDQPMEIPNFPPAENVYPIPMPGQTGSK